MAITMHGRLPDISMVLFIIYALIFRASIVNIWRTNRAGLKTGVKVGLSTLLRTVTEERSDDHER
jgi:hypothetical protein